MIESSQRRRLAASLVLCTALLAASVLARGNARDAAAAGSEWRVFGADAENTKYSPLDQIDASNFQQLEIGWRWESISTQVSRENPRVKPGQFKVVPLVVGGLLYVATEISQVAALDASTGELVWQHDPEAWKAGRPANVGFQHRGVAYFDDGESGRVFITTHDRKLVALDAKTGVPEPGFGDSGVVDLLPERGEAHFGRRVNHRHLTHSSPPSVVGSSVVVGSIVHDGAVRKKGPPGHVRAFDARTGAFKWIFHTIPQEGELGADTWEDESWRYSGAANVWSMMAVDEELGYVYLPTATPTNDYYGGHRLGDNLFAESLVCLDGETGERVWHFQAVHHGLWDYDFPTAPNLVDITVDGVRSPPSHRSRSRASPTCSIARRASRCGQSKSGRCRRPTCPASARPRRSLSRLALCPSSAREPALTCSTTSRPRSARKPSASPPSIGWGRCSRPPSP